MKIKKLKRHVATADEQIENGKEFSESLYNGKYIFSSLKFYHLFSGVVAIHD